LYRSGLSGPDDILGIAYLILRHCILDRGSGDIEALAQMAVCTRASDDYMGFWEQPSRVIILEVSIEAAAATYLVDKFYNLLMVE
jgi:hypothetical protein